MFFNVLNKCFFFNRKAVSRNALKLGGKSKDVDSFVDQLKSEGEKISNLTTTATGVNPAISSAKSKLAMDINVERLLHKKQFIN